MKRMLLVGFGSLAFGAFMGLAVLALSPARGPDPASEYQRGLRDGWDDARALYVPHICDLWRELGTALGRVDVLATGDPDGAK